MKIIAKLKIIPVDVNLLHQCIRTTRKKSKEGFKSLEISICILNRKQKK